MSDEDLIIRADNDVWMHIECVDALAAELNDYFTYTIPGAEFIRRQARFKGWGGKIRLFKLKSHRLYRGLLQRLLEFAASRNYTVQNLIPTPTPFLPGSDLDTWIETLQLPFEVRDYQLNTVRRALNEHRATIVSPTACHPAGTTVVMANGSLCRVENIVEGDVLLGPDGAPRHVIRTFQGENERIYDVTPVTGKTFQVNANHVLSLVCNNIDNKKEYGKIVNITVQDYFKQTKWFKHTHKLYHTSTPLEFHSTPIKLPIDPYFLGVLLGDGSLDVRLSVCTMDNEIVECIQQQGSLWNVRVTQSTKSNTKASSYHFAGHHSTCYRNENWLSQSLRSIGLQRLKCHQKHIPEIYKTAGISERRALLAGLIDTDGCLNNGTYYEIINKSKRLIDDIAFIARSLGFFVSVRTKHVSHINGSPMQQGPTDYYRVSICGDIRSIPTRIARKRLFTEKQPNKDFSRTGFTIHDTGRDDTVYGFELDGDRRYLLDDFLVTHNSGKSLCIYLIQSAIAQKTLIVTPTIGLIGQMIADFRAYGSPDEIHPIMSGAEKMDDARIYCSTWQSIYDMPKDYFKQFGTVIVDEVHLAKAAGLTRLMESCESVPYRFGFTGTLSETKVHQLQIEGLFGQVHQVATTAALVKQAHLSSILVKMLVLGYPEQARKNLRHLSYQEEIEFLVTDPARTEFIVQMVRKLTGCTLILFGRIQHGKAIYERLKTLGCDVHYIAGEVGAIEREDIRQSMNAATENTILVGSFGVASTGINIPGLNNLVCAAPSKGVIRVLQSIGRVLRLAAGKERATVYDIVDDLRIKKHQNFAFRHAEARSSIYAKEHFPVTMTQLSLEAFTLQHPPK